MEAEKSRKIAKIRLMTKLGFWHWDMTGFPHATATSVEYFKTRAEATTDAMSFCDDIGYEFQLDDLRK